MKVLILIGVVLVVACTQVKLIEKKIVGRLPIFPARPIEVTVKPGKVTYISFETGLSDGQHVLDCKDGEVRFYVKNQKAHAYLVESYFSDMKGFVCTGKDESQTLQVLKVTVRPYEFPKEKLNVDQKHVVLSKEDLQRVIEEKEIKERIYKHSEPTQLFNQAFILPLNTKVTSIYGTRRVFNNQKQTQHLGTDFRAQVGVPIRVSNRGKVVFCGHLFYSGNIVIVDHGTNIFTAYGHLSDMKVVEGAIVERGDIVGLSGVTGRVSGPHLHWGVKMHGHWVDGVSLVEASRKQFKNDKYATSEKLESSL